MYVITCICIFHTYIHECQGCVSVWYVHILEPTGLSWTFIIALLSLPVLQSFLPTRLLFSSNTAAALQLIST